MRALEMRWSWKPLAWRPKMAWSPAHRAEMAAASQEGHRRGREAEELVLAALGWHGLVHSARPATRDEDVSGVDVAFYTLGSARQLYLQVKVSPKAAQAWRKKERKRGGKRIAEVIVVQQGESLERLLLRVAHAVALARVRAGLPPCEDGRRW